MSKQKTFKEIPVRKGKIVNLMNYPYFHKSQSVIKMRKLYGKNALFLRCGENIFNLSSNPELFNSL